QKAWADFQHETEITGQKFRELRQLSDALWSPWAATVEKAADDLKKPQMAAKQTADEFRRMQETMQKGLLEAGVMASPFIKSWEDLRNVQDLLMKDELTYANMADPTMQIIKAALDKGAINWEQYRQVAGEAINIQHQFRLDELTAV